MANRNPSVAAKYIHLDPEKSSSVGSGDLLAWMNQGLHLDAQSRSILSERLPAILAEVDQSYCLDEQASGEDNTVAPVSLSETIKAWARAEKINVY